MCLCSSACDAVNCPICRCELEYKGFASDESITLYHCPECNRNYEWDDVKEKWLGLTKQILLLAEMMQYFQADARGMRGLIFELLEGKGSINQDSLILHRAIDLLQSIQTRIQKQIQDGKQRIEYQEKIKPMSRMQKRLRQKEREDIQL